MDAKSERSDGLGRGGVDILSQRPKPAAALFDGIHDVEKVSQRPCTAVVLDDDDHIALAKLTEELIEMGALPGRAADIIRKMRSAPAAVRASVCASRSWSSVKTRV